MSSGGFQGNGSNFNRNSFGQRSLDANMEPTTQGSDITGGLQKIPNRPASDSDVSHSSIIPVSSIIVKNKFFHQRVESTKVIAKSPCKARPSSWHSYDGPYTSDVAHSVRIPGSFAMETDKPFHQRAEAIQYNAESSRKTRPSSWHSYDEPYPSDDAHSVRMPGSFAMKENSPMQPRSKAIQNNAEFSPKTSPSSRHSYDKPYPLDVANLVRIPVSVPMKENRPIQPRAESSTRPRLIPREFYDIPYPSELLLKKTRIDTFSNGASKPIGNAGNNRGWNRVPPFKEFPLKLSDLPFTKQKIAESLSLGEACGYLKYFMYMGRDKLNLMERGLDQICIEMQMALRDARNICILFENSPIYRPEDINIARVHAEKLMHLIITSYRIYIKIAKSSKALKEGVHKYGKFRKDFHTGVDNLMEMIFKTVLEKCWSAGTYV